ncbi:MAG: hypothetical protein ABR881_02525 [Candidatus Sulfotelmatobacter sp.]|jgi:hypothetical protein
MKRVLLMVFLMVSLGELELERYRLCLFCSAAALAGLVWNGFANRRKAHCAPSPRASEAANPECLSTEQGGVAYAAGPHSLEDRRHHEMGAGN